MQALAKYVSFLIEILHKTSIFWALNLIFFMLFYKLRSGALSWRDNTT